MRVSNIASRLKEIMQERGLKQVDILRLAEPYCKMFNVKMGRNDLSQYVSGRNAPRQTKLTVLAMALQVNEVWLMGFDVPPTAKHETSKDSDIDSPVKQILLDSVQNMSDSEIKLMISIAQSIINQRNK